MSDRKRAERPLRWSAGVLAVVVAGLHAYWALPNMALQLQVRQFPDPRPAAFLLATMAILMGITLVMLDFDPLPIYVAGAALMLVFLVGYVAWHTVLEHGAFWPGREPHGHHDAGTVEIVIDHLANDTFELVSKLSELALLVVLSALATIEFRRRS
ncbi:hypothetical protein [Halorubrum vacuolatum]|uniref:Uncharacterized protein n=1 Tax=Halorubrum vacuolatum TaxID=63740 RepID=A0A238VNT0_HALVU|nr:hypothetical protein [Halorubrum vacuolatum]SNR35878.1 hypothetical protein SAMN06264855_103188 [Halorubrum vacuolatum]